MAMSVVSEIKDKSADLISNVGAATLNSIYPNEFNFYGIALELVNSQGNRELFLQFPVMPNEITISNKVDSTLVKTAGGMTSIINPSFTPKTIQFNGTFGRTMRLVNTEKSEGLKGATGAAFASFSAPYKATFAALTSPISRKKEAVFNNFVKTGYGVCKILEKMVEMTGDVDSLGKPYILLLYNLAFNQNYVVEPQGALNFTINSSKNFLYYYSLTLEAIAPLTSIKSAISIKKSNRQIKKNILSAQAANIIVGGIRSILNQTGGTFSQNLTDTYKGVISIVAKSANFDVEAHLKNVLTFFTGNDFKNIRKKYLSGATQKNVNVESSEAALRKNAAVNTEIVIIFKSNNSLQGAQSYEVFLFFEAISNIFATIVRYPFYNRYNNLSAPSEINVGQNLAVQSVSTNQNTNEWQQHAIDNNVQEGNYTYNSGLSINVTLQALSNELGVNDVVGNIEGDNILGRDILQEISFENNDLAVLSPIDTLRQAVNVAINSVRGDSFFYPQLFIENGILTGSQAAILNFPTFLRQLENVLELDDTISSFEFGNISKKDDTVNVSLIVIGKNGIKVTNQIVI